ncbi:MAG: FKBP-type peptidyl-prolyl cis-trans isomerase [Sphingobacteriia bacterium]|nr:FKBP-type peptidyl-prolyl cis-trans isomerase [Sphingobacteriia bacterium]
MAASAQSKTTKPAAKPAGKAIAKPATTAIVLKNSADSASYALGMRIAQNLKSQGLDPLNLAVFQKGMTDALQGKKPVIADELLDNCIGSFQQSVSAKKAQVARKAAVEFLAANGKRKGVVTLPSGMQYEIIKAGTDTVKPTLASKVKCHYHGTLMNGDIFDSSVDRGEPISFPLGNVIRGWQEGLQLMTVGSKWKLFIPADLAYGDQQKGDKIVPGSLLIFEVELLGIE